MSSFSFSHTRRLRALVITDLGKKRFPRYWVNPSWERDSRRLECYKGAIRALPSFLRSHGILTILCHPRQMGRGEAVTCFSDAEEMLYLGVQAMLASTLLFKEVVTPT